MPAARRGSSSTGSSAAPGAARGPAASMIYLSWKLCSGMAHGDFWTTWSAAQRVALPGAPDGVGTFKIEANVKMLMHVTTLATQMTKQGWQPILQRHPARPHPQDFRLFTSVLLFVQLTQVLVRRRQ